MEDERTPEEQFAAEPAESMVPRALREGRSTEDVVTELVDAGWSAAAARTVVDQIAADLRRFQESPETGRRFVAEARRQWVGGCLLVLAGIFFTVLTFLLTGLGLRYAVIPTGVIVAGLIVWGRGWGRWRYYRRLVPPDRSEPPVEGER